MDIRSPKKDHLLIKLEALQQNLNELIYFTKSSNPSQIIKNPENHNYPPSEDLFFMLDKSGNILNINQATLHNLGFQSKELLGLNFVDIVTTEQKKKCREYLNKLSIGFPSVSFETPIIKKDGSILNILCKAQKKGELIYALAGLTDTIPHKTSSNGTIILEKKAINSSSYYPFNYSNRLNGTKEPGPEYTTTSSEIELEKLATPWAPTIANNSPATMSTVDINGFIVETNELWLDMLGYKKEEVLGKEALQFFDTACQHHITDELIPEIAATGSAKSTACFMKHKNGDTFEVSLSGSLEYSSIQKIFKWLIFPKQPLGGESPKTKEIVVKKRTEDDDPHLHSEQHLKAIINSSKQILFLIDKKMDIIAFNKHAEELVKIHTGKTLKIGHNVLNFLAEEDAKGLKEIYEDVLGGRSVHLTRELTLPGNGKRWFEVNLYPVEDELVHVNNVVFSAEDITERKLSEEKFKELEINFKSIFTQVAVGVMLYNLNNEIIQANKRFYELIEYSKEEFEEIQPIGITHPEDREKSMKHTDDLINGIIDNYSLEKRYVTKSGRIVWVYLTATIVKNRQGKPKHMISVAQDITLRKTAEQELLYKKSELDTFVYRASHDLRGPVASLMGLYNIVKVEFANDKNAITYFEHYNNSVMRLHTVLQNLIDLTKIKESETKISQVDIKELIDNCLNSMKNLSDFHRITFNVEVDINFNVFIDAKKFKTILKNLVENSIIYATPESTAYVKVIVTYQENVLKIEVVDNGRGIDPRIQSKVFNMFFRGTEKSKGSGLGLYIVKNAVEKLNGSIQLTSKLNEGTKFSVYIPYLYGQEYTELLEKNFVN